jgi:FkbM family methyltransferase
MSIKKIKKIAWPYIKKFRTYIDVGASVGNTCIPLIDEFEKVVAFEPNPHSFAKLKEHKKIESYNVALSNKKAIAKLIIPTDNSEHGSISEKRQKLWKNFITSYDVSTETLDSFNFKNVDFIKVDVEQGELEVLQGSLETIKQYNPMIMFECKRNENVDAIFFLEKIGYRYVKTKSDVYAFVI